MKVIAEKIELPGNLTAVNIHVRVKCKLQESETKDFKANRTSF